MVEGLLTVVLNLVELSVEVLEELEFLASVDVGGDQFGHELGGVGVVHEGV